MSCGLAVASISLKDEREKRQQVNKNTSWSCFSLPLHPTHFEAAVQRMSKIQCPLFIYLSVKYFFFSPQVQVETNVWWHIWGTLKQPREKGRARKVKERSEMGVHMSLSVCTLYWACVSSERLRRNLCCGWSCRLFFTPQREGIFPLCFKFHRLLKWAQTSLENK